MPGTIICFGDSNTYGYDPTGLTGDRYSEGERWTDILSALTGWETRNCGLCGRQIPYGRARIASVCSLMESWSREKAPVMLLIMLGTNDILMDPVFTAEDAGNRMEEFISALIGTPQAESGAVSIIIMAPPRMRYGSWVGDEREIIESERLDGVYAELAERLGVGCIRIGSRDIPMSYDGVHMTGEGHRELAEEIALKLEDYFRIQPGRSDKRHCGEPYKR